MIDLHCHILPQLDDGALDLDDSLAMARQAEENGIAVVCATPHIRHDHNVRVEEIAARTRAVQMHLDDHGVGVQIVPGGELAQTEAARLTDVQLRRVALGGRGGWILLEPAPGPLGGDLEACVQSLAERGLQTIIAHPERHAGADFEERLRRLAGAGCMIQWTAEFIADTPGDLVPRVAEDGLVHLLGSDAHSSYAGRPVGLAAGFARLATVCTPARIAWMIDYGPQAILHAQSVTPPL